MKFKKYFIAGLLAIIPISLTAWLTIKVFEYTVGFADLVLPFRESFEAWISGFLPNHFLILKFLTLIGYVVSIALTLSLIFTVGFLALNYVGKQMMKLVEDIIMRIPLSKTIYSTVKQVSEVFLAGEEAPYKRVVVIEYPRKGLYSVGFLTNDKLTVGSGDEKIGDFVTVFIPTTPNPTSGFLIVAPKEDVRDLNMSVEDAAKLIISGGAVTPK